MQSPAPPAFLFAPWPGISREMRMWLRRNRTSAVMAGLLAFAAPLKFFIGFLGVAGRPPPAHVVEVGLWWVLYGAVFWAGLLVAGPVGEHLARAAGGLARAGLWLALALACAAAASLSTAGRAGILIKEGVVQGGLPMHLYAVGLSCALAMLYFAHLSRLRDHERAAARLTAAQAAQREARRRMVQVDLQAVQARIDPALLFAMLDAVRRAYADEPARAERLLEELIAFLRASLPRIRTHASSVAREAELARSYVRLLSMAQRSDWEMRLEISGQAMHARFPPGALVPLVDAALRAGGGECTLRAGCDAGVCCVTLVVPARPAEAALARVQALLRDIGDGAAGLALEEHGGTVAIKLWVPHETA